MQGNANFRRNGGPRESRPGTLDTLIGKKVLVILRTHYWFYGTLRTVDNRGILVTDIQRIEPVLDEEGNPVLDSFHKVTKRQALPFELPIQGLDKIIVRKMFVPWGNVGQILRAKSLAEIAAEQQAR